MELKEAPDHNLEYGKCVTHHFACDCREAVFKELIEAAEHAFGTVMSAEEARRLDAAINKARTFI